MSDVHVDITWNGSAATASPDPVPVKLSQGQNKVKWESDRDFTIHVQGTTINATQKNSKWEAKSQQLTQVGKIPYTISAAGGPPSDPEIDVQT